MCYLPFCSSVCNHCKKRREGGKKGGREREKDVFRVYRKQLKQAETMYYSITPSIKTPI